MRLKITNPFLWATVGICLFSGGPIVFAFAQQALPIIDTHAHYNVEARNVFDTRAIVEKLKNAGVSLAFVSSTPDDGTLALYNEDRARIVPILRPYRSSADRPDWWEKDAVLAYVLVRLERDVYRGIGEFHLWNAEQAKTAQMVRLFQEAVRRDLIIHVHSEADPIHAVYAVNPDVKVLWAHAGMNAAPEMIGLLLDRYPKLWTEVSMRAHDIAPAGQLAAAWRDLFLRHPDRFMIGTDTWTTSRWPEYADIVDEHRAWLVQLPGEVAEKIAFRNAQRLAAIQE
ncbi:MAG: amidohydrolase [Gammaproteobacteria bacterium]|nr:amidohydrolase [Gammaproteobacteria bacterium]